MHILNLGFKIILNDYKINTYLRNYTFETQVFKVIHSLGFYELYELPGCPTIRIA